MGRNAKENHQAWADLARKELDKKRGAEMQTPLQQRALQDANEKILNHINVIALELDPASVVERIQSDEEISEGEPGHHAQKFWEKTSLDS